MFQLAREDFMIGRVLCTMHVMRDNGEWIGKYQYEGKDYQIGFPPPADSRHIETTEEVTKSMIEGARQRHYKEIKYDPLPGYRGVFGGVLDPEKGLVCPKNPPDVVSPRNDPVSGRWGGTIEGLVSLLNRKQ